MNLFFNTKKFPITLKTAVYTTIHVIRENSCITLVSHELDGDWQFMGNEPIIDYRLVAMTVSLEEMINHDKSILKVADLQKGYKAVRSKKGDKWEIYKIEYSDDEIKEMGFLCEGCGEYHQEIPMSYVAYAPYEYNLITEEEVKHRCQLTSDQCIIDDNKFFIKGQLNIPVDDNEDFSWNPWVQISKQDFERTDELWTEENRFLEPPYSGVLATQIECYPNTLKLPVNIYTQKVGSKPVIKVLESSNPLYLEQAYGINMQRVISFARQLVYNH
jgi:hypothetical protein